MWYIHITCYIYYYPHCNTGIRRCHQLRGGGGAAIINYEVMFEHLKQVLLWTKRVCNSSGSGWLFIMQMVIMVFVWVFSVPIHVSQCVDVHVCFCQSFWMCLCLSLCICISLYVCLSVYVSLTLGSSSSVVQRPHMAQWVIGSTPHGGNTECSITILSRGWCI